MNSTWLYASASLVIALAFMLLGVRNDAGKHIRAAQRAFFLSAAVGVLCAGGVALMGESHAGEVFAFGLIASLQAAFIALLLWRFPRFVQSVIHTKHWDTPTT